jgi:hypothetical protein
VLFRGPAPSHKPHRLRLQLVPRPSFPCKAVLCVYMIWNSFHTNLACWIRCFPSRDIILCHYSALHSSSETDSPGQAAAIQQSAATLIRCGMEFKSWNREYAMNWAQINPGLTRSITHMHIIQLVIPLFARKIAYLVQDLPKGWTCSTEKLIPQKNISCHDSLAARCLMRLELAHVQEQCLSGFSNQCPVCDSGTDSNL